MPTSPGPTSNPVFVPIFEALASSKHVSVAPELGKALLDLYFCYQVLHVVDRSTFLQDMALGGPFFSEFLLMTLYAAGTRMMDGLDSRERLSQGDMFAQRSRDLLAKELEGPSRITTVQGLLVLSGRECALGHASRGWIHAGMVSARFSLLQLCVLSSPGLPIDA
jgi:hypothetical protein